MEITEVRIALLKKPKTTLKAFAAVTFEDIFVVTNIKVIEGKKGLFMSMPSQKGSDEEYYDVAYPITKEFRDEISEAVIKAYGKEIRKAEDKKKKKKEDDDE